MLKIEHVKKIAQEAIKIKNRKEQEVKKKQEEKELADLCKEIESDILDAARRGQVSCSIRMNSENYFELIKEKYADFNPKLINDEDDGEPFFEFTWE